MTDNTNNHPVNTLTTSLNHDGDVDGDADRSQSATSNTLTTNHSDPTNNLTTKTTIGAMTLKDRINEIDISNENQHHLSHTQNSYKVALFQTTHGYNTIWEYIQLLNRSVKSIKNSDIETSHEAMESSSFSLGISAVIHMLDSIESYIEKHDGSEYTRSSAAVVDNSGAGGGTVRFGNPAFRDFLQELRDHSEQLIHDVLEASNVSINEYIQSQNNDKMPSDHHSLNESKEIDTATSISTPSHDQDQGHTITSDNHHKSETTAPPSPLTTAASILNDLRSYLHESFGDIRRIDYGTGHELNFVCFLHSLDQLHVFQHNSNHVTTNQYPSNRTDMNRHLVLGVFRRYLRLMRHLQLQYWLEPAGSRGVWGLDDYCFLPFLWGSSQLIHHPHIKPRSVRYKEIADAYKHEYMYLDAISFVMEVKTTSFAEHSPMLNDITVVKTWEQVNDGLLKMYIGEVMGKWAVIQHFIFTSFLQSTSIKPVVYNETEHIHEKEEMPCCTDVIQIPSAMASKNMDLAGGSTVNERLRSI